MEEPGILAVPSSTHTAALSPRCGSMRRCSSWGTLPSHTPKAQPQPPSSSRPPSQHRSISSWVSSITVPQPFRMTLREARKKAQWLASPASFEPERRQAEKQGREEAECHRQFRAQPVPAHVYLPLYQEVMEHNEARRRAGIQKRKELLLSSLKPFSFLEKEEQRKQATLQRDLAATATTAKVPKQKATRKIPKSVLEPALGDKLQGKNIFNLPPGGAERVLWGRVGLRGQPGYGDGLFGGGPAVQAQAMGGVVMAGTVGAPGWQKGGRPQVHPDDLVCLSEWMPKPLWQHRRRRREPLRCLGTSLGQLPPREGPLPPPVRYLFQEAKLLDSGFIHSFSNTCQTLGVKKQMWSLWTREGGRQIITNVTSHLQGIKGEAWGSLWNM